MTANLVREDITAPGTSTTWNDESVYTSPARNQVALDFTIFKVDEDGVESAETVTAFDPKTATEFIATNTTDGRYTAYFIIINDWLVGATYNQYDLVWSPTEELFYQYINATPSAGNVVTNVIYFEEVANPSLKLREINTDTEPGNIQAYQIINKIVTFQTSICFTKAVSLKSKSGCDCDGDCGCDDKLKRLIDKIEDLFTVMELDEVRGLYTEGERNARLAQKYCDDCGCSCR